MNQRAVTLAIVPEAGRLLVALTDGRSLGNLGAVEVSEGDLARMRIAARAQWQDGDRSGSARRRQLGTELFSRLLPTAVQEALVATDARPLYLQVSEELADLPWEIAFDGESFLGEKFAVSRRLMGVVPPTGGAQREVLLRPSLRLLVAVADESAVAERVSVFRTGVEIAAAVEMAMLDCKGDPESVRQKLVQADIVRAAEVDLPALNVAESNAGAFASPSLWIISQGTEAAVPGALTRTVRRALAADASVLVLSESGGSTALEQQALAGIAGGLNLAEAVRQAVINESKAGRAFLYGDGDRILLPGAERLRIEDSRRQVSALQYDVVESTNLLESIGGERYSELLASCHERLAQIVQRHGGVANDARGNDGVMCYFGFPVAVEDAAVRAIRAGLALLDSAASLGVKLRVGVSTGEVVIREGQPFGTSVHLAARLQGLARPGTLVTSEATLELARNRFEAEKLPAVELKGIRKPGLLYEVRRERTDADAADSAVATPLIGRQRELQLLHEQWIEAAAGQLRLVQLTGDAGIGKSRLLREFRAHLEGEGAQVIECRCSSESQSSAFHPLIDYLRRALSIRAHDSHADQIAKIRNGLGALPGAEEGVWLIARLLEVASDPRAGLSDVSPARLRERTLEILLAWVESLTRRAALCVIVEDVNWIDPSSREFLRRVLAEKERQPLLVIVTQRTGVAPRWQPPVPAPRLELRGLPVDQARQLVAAVCRDIKLPNQTLRSLAERGDGVPLFLEESARMAIAMRDDAGGPYADIEVPSTIQGLLAARLEALGSARQVAQVAATIGREFPLALLQAVLQHEEISGRIDDLPAQLDALVVSGLLIEKGDIQDPRYFFKHALQREAAYKSLWESHRARLHRAIAEVIAARFGELADRQPELVAYHFAEARLDAEAINYWERAARLAASRSANDEAISHVDNALSLIQRLAASQERDRTELRLLLLKAARLIATEGYGAQQVEGVYRSALSIARALGDDIALSKVVLGLEGFCFMRGEFDAAQKLAQEAESLVAQRSDPMARLQSRWAVANLLFHRGALAPAVEHMNDCLRVYESLEHRPNAVQDPGVMCLCYSAWGLWELGYPDQALERAQRVVELAERLGHRFSMGEACGFRTTVHYFRGEYRDALNWAKRAIDICEDAGFVVWLAHARVMYGRILAELDDASAGVAEMMRGYETWADSGAVVTRPFYLAMQAEGLELADRHSEALDVLRTALQLIDRHGERYYEPEIRRLHGRLLLGVESDASGPYSHGAEEAERWFLSALSVARELQLRSLALRAATDLASLWLRSDRVEDARRLLGEARSEITGGAGTADLQRASVLLAQLETRTEARL
jgi:class 3 adenylate cyclase/tetratricopeptide (TPR) repeat protein/ABC-type transport system involved in cytochrome c biogenesis ATPase subunit